MRQISNSDQIGEATPSRRYNRAVSASGTFPCRDGSELRARAALSLYHRDLNPNEFRLARPPLHGVRREQDEAALFRSTAWAD